MSGRCVGTAVEILSGCRLSRGTTQLRIVNRFDDHKDAIIWLWPNGVATPAFGDPLGGTGSYELCVFDGRPPMSRRLQVAARADKAEACVAGPCWHIKGASGYLYRNAGAPFGMRQLFLKGGEDGKAKVLAKGRGASLHMPGDVTMTAPVRVQLRDSSTGECWEDVYTDADATHNAADRFKAKH